MESTAVLRIRPSWRSYWPAGLAAVALIGIGLLVGELTGGLARAVGLPASLGMVLALAPVVVGVLYHHLSHRYDMSPREGVSGTVGLVSRSSRQMPLTDQVQVDLEQGVVGRILGYGTLVFWTGDDRSRLEWRNVPDPMGLMGQVQALRAESGGGGKAGGGPEVSSLAPPTLSTARKTRHTHFGAGGPTAGSSPESYQTPFGTYVDRGDGTVSHRESGLRMVRAPWGMVWTGERFVGSPILLQWDEATRLFGRGAEVPYGMGETGARFGRAKRAAAAHRNGYDTGRCTVEFAGHADWRLATGDELGVLSASAAGFTEGLSDRGDDFGLTGDLRHAWRWAGTESRKLFERLYPELSLNSVQLWSANGVGGGLAWGFDGSYPVGDHRTRKEMGVMLVRNETPQAR